jgi:hypothetical protein
LASVVSSIVISKLLHCIILENFNLKWTRIQRGMDLGCYWMLFLLQRRVYWPALEVCYVQRAARRHTVIGQNCKLEKTNTIQGRAT